MRLEIATAVRMIYASLDDQNSDQFQFYLALMKNSMSFCDEVIMNLLRFCSNPSQ